MSSIMELVNAMYTYKYHSNDDGLSKKVYETIILLLSPFTPHLCEEIWNILGNKNCVSTAQWPKFNEQYIKQDTVEIPVQVNGKLRGKISIDVSCDEQAVKNIALSDDKLKPFFENKNIVKFIYIKSKIINVVVK